MLDTAIVIVCAIGTLACWLYLRFAPTYATDRKKRYIKPPKRN